MEHYTEDKITIIEGPPPTFELMNTEWTRSLGEGAARSEVALTRLRTFNGPALVERCHRAWRHKNTIHLEYRTPEGLHQTAPIIAARNVETDEGDMLLLWVRINLEEHDVSIEWEGEDEEYEEDSDEWDDEEGEDIVIDEAFMREFLKGLTIPFEGDDTLDDFLARFDDDRYSVEDFFRHMYGEDYDVEEYFRRFRENHADDEEEGPASGETPDSPL